MGPKSRTERHRKTKIGTEVARVTHDSVTTFKVKRSKVNLQGHIVVASHTACYITTLYSQMHITSINFWGDLDISVSCAPIFFGGGCTKPKYYLISL